jgi:hypothetical protein
MVNVSPGEAMKTAIVVAFASVLFFAGCEHRFWEVDDMPPSAPSGLSTSPGDNFIEIFWRPSPDGDVAGYNIYCSTSANGRFTYIGSSTDAYYVDRGAKNGTTYYYAISAYDVNDNESQLSREVVYDIARPEGADYTLSDFRTVPTSAGYDFSAYAVVPYTDPGADMWFEYYNGVMYMDVDTDSDIQDMGPTKSILDIPTAPASGWSTTHDVQLTAGHTYVVWTWDDHYAKFRVTSLSSGRVVFDWAYQLQKSNTLLKRAETNGMRVRPGVVPAHAH